MGINFLDICIQHCLLLNCFLEATVFIKSLNCIQREHCIIKIQNGITKDIFFFNNMHCEIKHDKLIPKTIAVRFNPITFLTLVQI